MLKCQGKSEKSQGISGWMMSGNPDWQPYIITLPSSWCDRNTIDSQSSIPLGNRIPNQWCFLEIKLLMFFFNIEYYVLYVTFNIMYCMWLFCYSVLCSLCIVTFFIPFLNTLQRMFWGGGEGYFKLTSMEVPH